MISTNDFKTGLTIEIDGELYAVVDFQHVKPGKGAAFVRSKLRNIKTGTIVEKTFRAGERVNHAHIEHREMQYLYSDGDDYYFMDTTTYEQMSLRSDVLGDAIKYLIENMVVLIQVYEGTAIGIVLPNSVELEVIQTDPGLKGDTASGGSKPAKLQTGITIQVPLFVEAGERVIVDTRSGEYLSRA
jgi:elongation factor P